MSRESRRAAFGRCPETCPVIDKAFDAAFDNIMHYIGDSIKEGEERSVEKEVKHYLGKLQDLVKEHGTEKLRYALDECESERLDLEEKLDEAETKNKELQGQVTSLEEAIEEQRTILNQAGTL